MNNIEKFTLAKDRYLGREYKTKEGYNVKVVEYKNYNEVVIMYNNGYKTKSKMSHIKSGNIKNPYHPSVHGVGYFGDGEYKSKINRKKVNMYTSWCNMLGRCYNEKEVLKFPTYKNTIVCKEWHNYQNFAKWYDENRKDYMDNSWDLDKDILIKGNKIYSPETCCFVPQEINTLFTKRNSERGELPIGVYDKDGRYASQIRIKGIDNIYLGTFTTPEEAFKAYKIAKEQYIKEVADKWRGLISEKVRQAMYNYQVEIAV